MRLLIVSAAIHYRFEGVLFGYAPYVREINLWTKLFDDLTIAAPCRNQRPPGDYIAFSGANVSLLPQRELGGNTLLAKIRLILSVPALVVDLSRAMRRAEAIHVRCPGNLSLLGLVLAPLFSQYLVAKYAGEWNPRNGVASERLQRWILRTCWRSPVTVYGHWPGQPGHVIPFFSSAFTRDQLRQARSAALARASDSKLRVIFVGRLSKAKNVDVLLAAVSLLDQEQIEIHCRVVGEGPERPALERLAAQLGIGRLVEFTGGVSSQRVTEYLKDADALVLISESEGWPKALAEGMAFGLVCIGAHCGIVPQMLAEGRGIVVPVGELCAVVNALRDAARRPEAYLEMRQRASEWAQQYSLERLQASLQELLQKHWRVPLGRAAEEPLTVNQ